MSFEKISILDSYLIHRYIIIKYRTSSIKGKIHQLLWELWPFFSTSLSGLNVQKMISVRYLLKRLVY